MPEQMNARTGHLDKQKELAHLNPKLRRAILGGGDLLLAGAGADVYYAAL
ncbi:Cellulose synthase catalytic subunit [UDP-forming] [Klebsiella pneumoniae IS46]|nr:Cellulose synthase catalytic subunit [UDP-forming] [Klebsiella pneumoniae IS46]